jgi:hypothetical protein
MPGKPIEQTDSGGGWFTKDSGKDSTGDSAGDSTGDSGRA